LNTKDKNYNIHYYEQIRPFFVKQKFVALKDSNYLSLEKLSDQRVHVINRTFVFKFPQIVNSLTKLDWTILKPELVNHSLNELKKFKNLQNNKNNW
jgi:hypothetical protein